MSDQTKAIVWAVQLAISHYDCSIVIVEGSPNIKGLSKVDDEATRELIINACKAIKGFLPLE